MKLNNIHIAFSRLSAAVVLFLISGIFYTVTAQEYEPGFYDSGIDGPVLTSIDIDGTLYIGGDFAWYNGESFLNNTARWEDASQNWVPVGAGLDGIVNHLIDFEGELYAGGLFYSSDGAPVSNVAMWNADLQSWQTVAGGLNNEVKKLAVHNGALYAVGRFTRDGDNNDVRGAARLTPDTDSWEQMGQTSITTPDIIHSLLDELFIFRGGLVLRWNEDVSDWEEYGSFFGNNVKILAAYEGELYAGGRFGTTGDETVRRVARFDTTIGDWVPVGWGLSSENFANPVVRDLAKYEGNLYAVGQFSLSSNTTLSNIARLDKENQTWHPVSGSPTSGSVFSATVSNGLLVLGGVHQNTEIGYKNIAAYDGNTTFSLGTDDTGGKGLNARVVALMEHEGRIFAGGSFNRAGEEETDAFAVWYPQTGSWTTYQSDLGAINAFTKTGSGQMFAAVLKKEESTFTRNQVRIWDEEEENWNTTSGVFNNTVFTLTAQGDDLIAGGFFTTRVNLTVNYIARRTPDGEWAPMDEGFNNFVFATTLHNGDLYAAGRFTHTHNGETELNHVARWNEAAQSWEPVGAGFSNDVFALHSFGGDLYAAGQFVQSGGEWVLRVARFNDDTQIWEQVGEGLNTNSFNDVPRVLSTFNGELYVGGEISGSGSTPLSGLARYDAASDSWQPVGGGTDAEVAAFAASGNQLYIGGAFRTAGNLAASRFTYIEGGPVSTEPETEISASIKLAQNYPNPFNPTTLIEFELKEPVNVRLDVFNMTGQRIATLTNGPLGTGSHSVSFDGTGLSSGIYFYRIEAGGFMQTRKMMLIK